MDLNIFLPLAFASGLCPANLALPRCKFPGTKLEPRTCKHIQGLLAVHKKTEITCCSIEVKGVNTFEACICVYTVVK